MADAVVAQQLGHEYQARFFWVNACDLFIPEKAVERVGYELDEIKSFDDVVVHYKIPVPDGVGGSVDTDYHQVKFHVNYAGEFGVESFLDPAAIGATSECLLQKINRAYRVLQPKSKHYRLHLWTPWPVAASDPLAELLSTRFGELKLEKLREGKTESSRMGNVRKKFKEKLCLSSDAELEAILHPFRLHVNAPSLDQLRVELDNKLRLVGLKPVAAEWLVHPYDDLIKKTHAAGKNLFVRHEIEKLCKGEGLFSGTVIVSGETVRIGIRAFSKGAEEMAAKVDAMLCMLHRFEQRKLRQPHTWHDVQNDVLEFMRTNVQPARSHLLQLDAHASAAFTAGWGSNPKQCGGGEVIPLQRTVGGTRVWHAETDDGDDSPAWNIGEAGLNRIGTTDIAVALGVTHDITHDVRLFAEWSLPAVGRIITFAISPKPRSTSILDGPHALKLVQDAVAHVKKCRTDPEYEGIIHFFWAMPNGMVFRLGQSAHGLGRIVIYEHDFESGRPGSYSPSMTFPPVVGANGNRA